MVECIGRFILRQIACLLFCYRKKPAKGSFNDDCARRETILGGMKAAIKHAQDESRISRGWWRFWGFPEDFWVVASQFCLRMQLLKTPGRADGRGAIRAIA
jgi:hypothetical protein